VLDDALGQLRAVRQPGQRIAPRLVPQPLDEPDVLHRHGEMPGQRAKQREVVVGESGAVAEPVHHGQ
jgi:hypothetical protein